MTNSIPESLKDNGAYMNIVTRSSIRRYLDKPVTDEQTEALLYAGMCAPSGVNRQPWEFVVISDPSVRQLLADALPYAKMTAQAAIAIVVCGNKERFLEGVDGTLWVQDLSAVSENILLAAHSLGLGGVWTCIYPHPERIEPVSAIVGLPDHIIPFCLIPVGYPERPHEPMDKWHTERIHYNRF